MPSLGCGSGGISWRRARTRSVESSRAIDGHVRDEETWWATDNSGEVRNHSTRQDKYPYPPSGTYVAGKFPIELDLSELSTDPEQLAAQLGHGVFGEQLAGTPEPERVWRLTGSLLLDYPNSAPNLRAALFAVAADVQGITVIQDAQDPVGRRVIALEFSVERDGITWREYFDPSTHQLMAWTSTYNGNAPAWEILESGIVESAGVRPEGNQWLFPGRPTNAALPRRDPMTDSAAGVRTATAA